MGFRSLPESSRTGAFKIELMRSESRYLFRFQAAGLSLASSNFLSKRWLLGALGLENVNLGRISSQGAYLELSLRWCICYQLRTRRTAESRRR